MLAAAVAAGFDELEELALADRSPVDLEGRQVELVHRPLVVVGEAGAAPPHPKTAGRHPHPAGGAGGGGRQRAPAGGRIGRGLEHLHRLQQGLLVLLLVLGDHLVDQAAAQQLRPLVDRDPGQHRQALLAHPLEVGAERLLVGQRQALALRPRIALRVEHRREVPLLGSQPGQPPAQPLFLEMADMAEVPDHRAEDGDLLAPQGAPVQHRDQRQRPLPHLPQAAGDRLPVECRVGAQRHPQRSSPAAPAG